MACLWCYDGNAAWYNNDTKLTSIETKVGKITNGGDKEQLHAKIICS